MKELVETLRRGSGTDTVSYDLPELRAGSFLASCAAGQRTR
jgi:hypothetical protein